MKKGKLYQLIQLNIRLTPQDYTILTWNTTRVTHVTVVTRDSILFIYDIFKQQLWLANSELNFINTCKDQMQRYILETIYFSSNSHLFHAKISTTSLAVPDFIQQGWFVYLQKERKLS